MTVDDGDGDRRDVIAGARLIEVGAGFEQRLDGVELTLPRRQVQRRQAALGRDQLGIEKLTIDTRLAGRAGGIPAGARWFFGRFRFARFGVGGLRFSGLGVSELRVCRLCVCPS